MAEAFPNEINLSAPADEIRTISVLFLGTKWHFDTYGLSTVNKSLVNNLRMVDPEGKSIKITCAVMEEEGKIKETDLIDATKHGVELKGAKRPRGSRRFKKPKLQWLNEGAMKYYCHLHEHNYDFIIGHAPYMANGCLNLKDLYRVKDQSPKIILIFHSPPQDENGDTDDDDVDGLVKGS